MLDVHPPHEPTHTWKDFFIHIATICVGLLIAIGLEQTVEYFHRLEQGNVTTERIRAQAERNRTLTASIELWDYRSMEQDVAVVRLLQSAPVRDGHLSVTLPPDDGPDASGVVKPSMEAWEAARADGTARLLSPGLDDVYGRVYFELQQEGMPYAAFNANLDAMDVFQKRYPLDLTPGHTVTLTLEQRDQLISLLSTDAGLRDRDLERWQSFAIANQALLDGASSLSQVIAAFRHETPYQPPSDGAAAAH